MKQVMLSGEQVLMQMANTNVTKVLNEVLLCDVKIPGHQSALPHSLMNSNQTPRHLQCLFQGCIINYTPL